MKKHNISQFFKNKGFYVVLFLGVMAIAIVSFVGVKLTSKNQNDLVDLNTPIESVQDEGDAANIADGKEDAANTNEAADSGLGSTKEAVGDYTNDELLEYDVYGMDDTQEADASEDTNAEEETKSEELNELETADIQTEVETEDMATTDPTEETVADQAASEETAQEAQAEEAQTTETAETAEDESVTVMQPNAANDGMSFSVDTTISWPVLGNVVMPYSMDSLVHFATLGEWKVNPAIMISCETGTEVKAACKGIVSDVSYNEETGNTVTMNVGDGYEITYGQLNDVTCKAGDVISEGTVLGTVADPTMYYSVEGSNLYLKITENGNPVNPMLFLTGEE